jgi:hypothetical protein
MQSWNDQPLDLDAEWARESSGANRERAWNVPAKIAALVCSWYH